MTKRFGVDRLPHRALLELLGRRDDPAEVLELLHACKDRLGVLTTTPYIIDLIELPALRREVLTEDLRAERAAHAEDLELADRLTAERDELVDLVGKLRNRVRELEQNGGAPAAESSQEPPAPPPPIPSHGDSAGQAPPPPANEPAGAANGQGGEVRLPPPYKGRRSGPTTRERMIEWFKANPGQWIGPTALSEAIGSSPASVGQLLGPSGERRPGRRRFDLPLEHNGKRRLGAGYRYVEGDTRDPGIYFLPATSDAEPNPPTYEGGPANARRTEQAARAARNPNSKRPDPDVATVEGKVLASLSAKPGTATELAYRLKLERADVVRAMLKLREEGELAKAGKVGVECVYGTTRAAAA